MILINKNYNLTLADVGDSYKMIKYVRDAAKSLTSSYTISKSKSAPGPLMQLLGKTAFQMAISNLDPAKSLPLAINTLVLDAPTAAVRIDELYRLVLGLTEFPGNSNPEYLNKWGFELRIDSMGQQLSNQAVTKISAGSAVTSDFPISSLTSVSAEIITGPLTISSVPNLQLGVVNLLDGGSPVSDGTQVSLAYETIAYTIFAITEPKNRVDAILASKGLIDYLTANAL